MSIHFSTGRRGGDAAPHVSDRSTDGPRSSPMPVMVPLGWRRRAAARRGTMAGGQRRRTSARARGGIGGRLPRTAGQDRGDARAGGGRDRDDAAAAAGRRRRLSDQRRARVAPDAGESGRGRAGGGKG